MRNPRAIMIEFKDIEWNDNRKRKALRQIIRVLKFNAGADYVLNDIVKIAEDGLVERGYGKNEKNKTK